MRIRTMLMSQVRRRPGRATALLVGVLVAVSSFAVLTAATETSRLEVVGTVEANAGSAYDVLVRPAGSALPLETTEGLVRPNFLSDHFGGTTLDQVEQIRQIPGVHVAAPIAMIGYSVTVVSVPVDLGDNVPRDRRSLFRLSATRVVDGGLTRIVMPDAYTYLTPNELGLSDPGALVELAGGEPVGGCPALGGWLLVSNPYSPGVTLTCRSLSTFLHEPVSDPTAVHLSWPMPFLVAAVDPAAEAALVGLDRAVDAGEYLPAEWEVTSTDEFTRDVPVLYSGVPTTDVGVELTVAALPEDLAERVPGTPYEAVTTLTTEELAPAAGEVVWSGTVTAADAYASVERALTAEGRTVTETSSTIVSIGYPMDAYWTPGPVVLRPGSDGVLEPRPRRVPESVFASGTGAPDLDAFLVPPETGDVAFRGLVPHGGSSGYDEREGDHYSVALRAVGRFDPGRIAGFSELTAVPLTTYAASRLECADARSCGLLGVRPLLPNGSPAGYLQQPPLILTTLDALPAFYNSYYRDDATAGAAPVSAVRVRVDGVTGFDELSRERVRLVAEQIATVTGLDVDVTMGSSPSPQLVNLPAGDYGRPELTLSELWTKKGVAAVIIAAVDRKSLVLLGLVLVVCALFVGNAAASAVRERRGELGVLAALGWSRRWLFAAVLGELLTIGLSAGALGTAVAWLVGGQLDLAVSWWRAVLAVPAALVLTVVAGMVPAWTAARVSPMAALSPPVWAGRRARLRLGLAGFAAANLRRRPGRALLGGAALALGTSAFMMLLAVTNQFQGSLVGTLLGEAIAVQIRGVDVAAVVAMLVLAGVAIADVLYLNVRDRAPEFAALRATGWSDSSLARLIALEGLLLGAIAALAGTVVGAGGAAWFAGTPAVLPRLVPTGAVTVGVGVALAALALVAPMAALRSRSTVRLLAEG
jgi:hypothetical protein